jgi:hypothetical protein
MQTDKGPYESVQIRMHPCLSECSEDILREEKKEEWPR